MTITELLQAGYNARVAVGNRWIVGNWSGEYTVYERKPYAKKTITVCETKNEATAVAALVED